MITALKNYFKPNVPHSPVIEKGSAEAYDLWAASYDSQPGNLMIDLDEKLFGEMLKVADISDKQVADIGCGSGRHWHKLMEKHPQALTGFDVSEGMLHKLKEKFPQANVHQITDDLLLEVAGATFDFVVSTLTMAHIPDIAMAMHAWARILKPDAEIMITDFHPDILASGGKRTFRHGQTSIAVKNFVYPVDDIIDLLETYDFHITVRHEIKIDESMKHYYAHQNALAVYQKYKGFPVIYGIHLKRGNGAQ